MSDIADLRRKRREHMKDLEAAATQIAKAPYIPVSAAPQRMRSLERYGWWKIRDEIDAEEQPPCLEPTQ